MKNLIFSGGYLFVSLHKQHHRGFIDQGFQPTKNRKYLCYHPKENAEIRTEMEESARTAQERIPLPIILFLTFNITNITVLLTQFMQLLYYFLKL